MENGSYRNRKDSMKIIGTWHIEFPPERLAHYEPARRFWFWTDRYSMGYPVKRKNVIDLYFGKFWLAGLVKELQP